MYVLHVLYYGIFSRHQRLAFDVRSDAKKRRFLAAFVVNASIFFNYY